MKDFIKKRLHEDLEYYHVNGSAIEDKYEIGEDINVSYLSLDKVVELSKMDRINISKLNWSDLIIDQKNDSSPIHISIDVPWESNISDGIAVDLQIINDVLFQIHISITPNLRGLGLGYKIHKALIMTYGHLYLGKGRMQNTDEIPKIWAKLSNDSEISCSTSQRGELCVSNQNPDKEYLLNINS